MNKCDFSKYNLEFIPPNSLSDTLIFFGNLIVLKVSLIPKDTSLDNSLLIEQDIYKNIVNRLLKNKITPHLVALIDSFVCNNFMDLIKLHPKAIEQLNKIYEFKSRSGVKMFEFYYRDRANIMVLERNHGFTLSKRIADLPAQQIKSLVFQVLYTLAAFNKVGLTHNDIHMGNILVQDTNVPEFIDYITDYGVYHVPTYGLLAKIYDFDWAQANKTNTKYSSPFFDSIKEHGCVQPENCNLNPMFDTWFFLGSLITLFSKSDKLTDFMDAIVNTVSDDQYKYYFDAQAFKNKEYPRFCNTSEQGKCEDQDLNEILTPDRMIEALFSNFKIPFDRKILSNAYFISLEVRKKMGLKTNILKSIPTVGQQFNSGCQECEIRGNQEILNVLAKITENIKFYLKNANNAKLDLRTYCNIFNHCVFFLGQPDLDSDLYELIGFIITSIYLPIFKKMIPDENMYNYYYNIVSNYNCKSAYDLIFFCDQFKKQSQSIRRKSSEIDKSMAQAITSLEGIQMTPMELANKVVTDSSKQLYFKSQFSLGETVGYLNLAKLLR